MPRSKKKKYFVLLLFIFAIVALGSTFYFGLQEESSIILPTRATIDVLPKKAAVPLSLWAIGAGDSANAIRQAVAEIESAQGQKIDLRFFKSRMEYETAQIVAVQNKQMPDIFWVSAEDVEQLDQSGVLQRIALDQIDANQWLAPTLSPFIRHQGLLAFPAQYSVSVLYYNKTEFDRIGVAYPDTSWNWDTLLSVSRALYRPAQGGRAIAYALEMTPTMELWNAFFTQAGQPLYQTRTWMLGVPELLSGQKQTLQFLIDLVQTYSFCAPPVAAGKPSYFVRGEAAMRIDGPELRDQLQGLPDLKWGIAPLPDQNALEPGKSNRATPLRLGGWAIATSCSQLELAVKTAERLSTITRDGWLPARKGADPGGEGAAVFTEALSKSIPPFINPQTPRLAEIFNGLLNTLPSVPTNADKFLSRINTGISGINLKPPAAPTPGS